MREMETDREIERDDRARGGGSEMERERVLR